MLLQLEVSDERADDQTFEPAHLRVCTRRVGCAQQRAHQPRLHLIARRRGKVLLSDLLLPKQGTTYLLLIG